MPDNQNINNSVPNDVTINNLQIVSTADFSNYIVSTDEELSSFYKKFVKVVERTDNKFVNDFRGKSILRENAVYIKNIGRYIDKSDPSLCKDYFDGEDIIKDFSTLLFSKFTEDGNIDRNNDIYYTIHQGFFPDVYDNKGNRCKMNNIDVLINNGYNYIPEAKAFLKNNKNKSKQSSELTYEKFQNIPSEFGLDEKNPLKYGIKSPTYLITEGKKYTFGVEIETILGNVPYYLRKDLNINCVYDGSLKNEDGIVLGGEYTTGVLTGDTGFRHLKLICDTLSNNCKINKKCGVHVHLGNIIFDKITLYFIYQLAISLQKEIFSILPKSRRDNEYCRLLPKLSVINNSYINDNSKFMLELESWYNEFIYLMSKKSNSPSVNKKENHPQGSKCNYDHSTARYCWLNFVPAVFNTRENGVYSIEFRPHSATLSYNKIKNWILICMAIISVAENNKRDILECKNITLEWLLTLAYPKNHNKLIRYINDRKICFSKDVDSNLQESLEYDEKLTINNKSFKELVKE